ncbi:hypothetical protein ACWFOS_17065 [Gordonia terrae]
MLTVSLDALEIDDGSIPPPRIGSLTPLWLDFHETSEEAPGAATVHAVLDLHPTPRLDGSSKRPEQRRWYWTGDLIGDGWRATWIGRRPKMGQVELTGQFRQSGGVAFNRNATVRGRVTRVQLRTTLYHHREGTWQPVPDSPSTYHDVDEAPRWFDRGGMGDADPGSDAVFSVQTGVMIDLDLDDVDPPPPRPRIEPESVAAGDHGIWVVDNQLPVAVLLSGDTATEYVFPGTITSGRTILATSTGCTITEGLDTYHCTVGEPIHKPSTLLPHVALGDVSLRWEHVNNTHWRAVLTSSTDEQVAVIDLPADQQLSGMVIDSGTFVVAVQDTDDTDTDPTVRFIRITTAGEVTQGPKIPIAPQRWIHRGRSLFHTPLRFRQDKDMYPINSDLSAGKPVRLPDSPLTAGQTATTAWISTHPRNPRQPTGPCRSRRQFWVVTLLDADSQPFASYPTSSPTPALTTDRHGRHWITDHGLRPLPTEPMTWSDPINLDAAITATIYPSPAAT